MRSDPTARIGVGAPVVLLTLAILATLAGAQASDAPSSYTTAPQLDEALGGGVGFVLVVTGALAAIGIAVTSIDLKRRRDEEAAFLQARITDALFLDPGLARAAIAVTARVPFWRGSPVTVEVTGQVPTPALREAAVRLVLREVSGNRLDFRMEERIAVVPRVVSARAA